jgi:hypothetical protein
MILTKFHVFQRFITHLQTALGCAASSEFCLHGCHVGTIDMELKRYEGGSSLCC